MTDIKYILTVMWRIRLRGPQGPTVPMWQGRKQKCKQIICILVILDIPINSEMNIKNHLDIRVIQIFIWTSI